MTCTEQSRSRQAKILGFVASGVICLLFLAAGCAQPAKEAPKIRVERKETAKVKPQEIAKPEVSSTKLAGARKEKAVETKVEPKETIKAEAESKKQGPTIQLALKFAPDDLTTYKVITEMDKSVKWEGPLPDKAFEFKGGATGNRVEMTFAQRIQGVDDEGNAVAQITVKGLKYLGKVKDNVVADFDSSREKDANNPLFKLVGQSYTIEVSPAGQVLRVIDVGGAQAAVGGSLSANKTALALLSPDVIKERHTIPGLPAADKNRLHTGDNWSSIKAFSFDMMGAKSYEKIYTLKDVKEVNNRRIAVVEMKAIPSSEMAEELHKEQAGGAFTKMFDNTETYSGKLALDLTEGKIQQYSEKLRTEWVMVDPRPEPDKEPAALRMAALRIYSIVNIEEPFEDSVQKPKAGELEKIPNDSLPKVKPDAKIKSGTAFAVSPKGHLITAYHLVKDATEIRVRFEGRDWLPSRLDKYSFSSDVALLKIDEPTPNYLRFAEASTVKQGQKVFTLGYPVPTLLGAESKYSEGTISSLSGIMSEYSLIQISLPVQPGNSGGPLLNLTGEVVGMITSTAAVKTFFDVTGTLPQNVNWAIKADYITPLLPREKADEPETKTPLGNNELVDAVRDAICLVEAR